jgi:Concanavalin A-like lectin/glucanases superfamily
MRLAPATVAMLLTVVLFAPQAHADTYSGLVTADGARSLWRLGEGSGSVAHDAIGANPGAFVGGVALGQPGAVSGDSAVTLNGSTGYVRVPDSASLHTGDSFSVELWVKLGRTGVSQGLASKGGYLVALDGAGHVMLRKPNVGNVVVSTGAIADTSSWHQVVVTKAGAAAHVFIDGVDRSGAVTNRLILDTTSQLVLGAGSGYLKGGLDEVAIYPRALTATEVTAHYAAR